MPGLPVHYQLPEFTQTHVHQVRLDIAMEKIANGSGENVQEVAQTVKMIEGLSEKFRA